MPKRTAPTDGFKRSGAAQKQAASSSYYAHEEIAPAPATNQCEDMSPALLVFSNPLITRHIFRFCDTAQQFGTLTRLSRHTRPHARTEFVERAKTQFATRREEPCKYKQKTCRTEFWALPNGTKHGKEQIFFRGLCIFEVYYASGRKNGPQKEIKSSNFVDLINRIDDGDATLVTTQFKNGRRDGKEEVRAYPNILRILHRTEWKKGRRQSMQMAATASQ